MNNKPDPKRERRIIRDYFELGNGQVVAKKYGISRERVRQILEKNGLNGPEIKRAVADYKYAQKVNNVYRTCSRCRRYYRILRPTEMRMKFPHLCIDCYEPEYNKALGYKFQKEWIKRNPERVRERNRRASLLWHTKHPIISRRQSREYFNKNREVILEKFKQAYIKKRLMEPNEIDFLEESNYIEGVRDGLEQSVKAWAYAKTVKEMTHKAILKIHKVLMKGRLEPKYLGHYRRQPVWIGGHEALSYHNLETALNALLYYLNLDELPTEYAIKQYHVMFENIHPFIDGNGRVGRILYNWQRIKHGYPIHVIKSSESYDYYKWFDRDIGVTIKT